MSDQIQYGEAKWTPALHPFVFENSDSKGKAKRICHLEKKTLVLNVARLKCDLRGVLFRIVSKISNI